MENTGTLLITGASGFVGRELLRQASRFKQIYALQHQTKIGEDNNITPITIDELNDLHGIDTIIHCAALIKGSKEQMSAVNVDLTSELLNLAKREHSYFLFISSLNSTLPLKGAYETTKLEAEELVRAAPNLKTTIIRPSYLYSIDEEPNLQLFRKVEKLFQFTRLVPILPFNALVSPLDVGELVNTCLSCIQTREYDNQILEMSGPDEREVWEMIESYLTTRIGKLYPLGLPAFLQPLLSHLSRGQLDIMFQDKILRPCKPGVTQIRGKNRQPF